MSVARAAAAMVGGEARRAWRAPALLALAGYVLAVTAATWPLAAHMGRDTYGGPGDGWALIWQTRERWEIGPSYFSPSDYAEIAWPFGTRFPSGILLSNIVTEIPNFALLAIGLGDVPAYNVLTFAAAVTSAMAMFLVLRRLDVEAAAAFWGGLVLILVPWELDRLAIHLTLATLVALPLLLLGAVKWIRRPDLRSGGLLVIAVAVAIHTHVYYGLIAALALAMALPLAALVAYHGGRLREMAVRSAVLAGALLLVATPLIVALVSQRSSVSRQLERPLYLSELALKPHLLGLPSEDNPVFGGLVRDHIAKGGLASNTGELALYLGWVTIALAVCGLVAALIGRTPRLPAGLAATWVAAGLVLSLPETVGLPLLGETSMPIAYLQDMATFISTPTRFFVMTIVGVIVLAALGLETLRPLMGVRPWLGIVALAVVLSAIELPVDPSARLVDATTPPPIVLAVMNTIPKGEPVAQYPSVDRSLQAVADQLYWHGVHWHPVLNGAASQTFEDAVRREVSAPQDRRTPGLLSLLGFRWLTLDPAGFAISPGGWSETRVPHHGVSEMRALGDGSRIFRVTAPAAPGIVVRWTGFSNEGPTADTLWLASPQGELLVCASRGGTHRLSFRSSAFAQQRTLRIGDGTVRVPVRRALVEVGLDLPLRTGWQVLPIRLVGSQAQRPSDLVEGSDDYRLLSVSVGHARLEGPPGGDPRPCRTRPAKALLAQ